MEEKTSIILSHRREGMSIREIARRNGMSRKTVRKYLREFEREAGPSPTEREVDDYLLTRPKYDSSGRVRRVVTDDVRRRIDGFIARNRENVAAGLHKQQMRKLDMWRRLQDDGVRIAYSTVCQYVRALEAAPKSQEKPAKAYIRQDYEPGFRCEFDWGVLTLWIDRWSQDSPSHGGIHPRPQQYAQGISVFARRYPGSYGSPPQLLPGVGGHPARDGL